jgi:hypothetical membrane protein
MAAPSEPRLGPLVHRAVHHGAALWLAGTLLFVLAMVVVQLAWSGPPAYSLKANYISDLGNTGCGPWPSSTSARVCSPWHDVFNGAIIVLGVFIPFGAILSRTAFPKRRSATVGLGLLAIAGIGAMTVGFSPENVNLTVHTLGSVLAFLFGNLALIVLGFAMFRDTRWDGYRAYSMFSGLIGLVALALFASHDYVGLGVGGMERLIVAPPLLWLLLASIHLLRIPQYAPHALPSH